MGGRERAEQAKLEAPHLVSRFVQFPGLRLQRHAEDRELRGRQFGAAQRLDHDLKALVLDGDPDRSEVQRRGWSVRLAQHGADLGDSVADHLDRRLLPTYGFEGVGDES